VDIVERDNELALLADLPGACPDGIDVHFEKGTLTIHGKVEDRQPGGTRFLLREYGAGDYWRTFEVGEAINASAITAEYSNGVLTLHLPKVEAARPRKIAVRSS
jgi:HSP20 family molecular chaperone IbpA